jgi:hypothetical protein
MKDGAAVMAFNVRGPGYVWDVDTMLTMHTSLGPLPSSTSTAFEAAVLRT